MITILLINLTTNLLVYSPKKKIVFNINDITQQTEPFSNPERQQKPDEKNYITITPPPLANNNTHATRGGRGGASAFEYRAPRD